MFISQIRCVDKYCTTSTRPSVFSEQHHCSVLIETLWRASGLAFYYYFVSRFQTTFISDSTTFLSRLISSIHPPSILLLCLLRLPPPSIHPFTTLSLSLEEKVHGWRFTVTMLTLWPFSWLIQSFKITVHTFYLNLNNYILLIYIYIYVIVYFSIHSHLL